MDTSGTTLQNALTRIADLERELAEANAALAVAGSTINDLRVDLDGFARSATEAIVGTLIIKDGEIHDTIPAFEELPDGYYELRATDNRSADKGQG